MRSRPTRRTAAALAMAVIISAGLTSVPPTTASADELGPILQAPFGQDISRADVVAAWDNNILVDFGWRHALSTDNGATWQPSETTGELSSVESGTAVFTKDIWVEVFDMATNEFQFHWMPPGLAAWGADSRTAVVVDNNKPSHPFVALDLATAGQVQLHSEKLLPPAGATDSKEHVSVFSDLALDLVDQLDASSNKLATDIDVMPLDGSAGPRPVRVNGLVAYAAIRGDQVEIVRRAGTDVSLCSWPVAAAQGNPDCRSIATLGEASQSVWADRSGDVIRLDFAGVQYLWEANALKKVTYEGSGAKFEGTGRPTRPLIRVENGTHHAVHQVDPSGATTLLFSDPSQPVAPDFIDLAADRMVGISVNLAMTEAYFWWRSITPDAIGDESRPGGDGYVLATAGRVFTAETGGMKFYDRGRLTGTGPVVSGLQSASGPYVLTRASRLSQPWTIRTSAGPVAATHPLAIFGSRYVGRGPDVDGRPQLFVRDLAKPASPAITFSIPQVSGGDWIYDQTTLWGDWVSFSIWTREGGEDEYFYNYVTGAPPTVFRDGRLLDAGDGVALIEDVGGKDDLVLWNYLTGDRTSLDYGHFPASIDDANRVAYVQDDGIAVATVPGMGLSAPRLLGTVAPATFRPNDGPWTPEFDATKPLAAGTLEISHGTGSSVVVDRVLSVPPSSDGSIRDVAWDGKDDSGNPVADGQYTWTLKVTDAADAGKALFAIDGRSPASGTVAVKSADGTPEISDTTPVVEQTLTAKPGAGGPGSQVAFTWYRGTKAIAGSNTRNYTVQPADTGKELRVKVTVTKPGSSAKSARSARTKKVKRGAFISATTPVVTGSIKAGMALSAAAVATPRASKIAFQWYRGTKRIGGATRSQYTTTSADVGKRLKVRATYLRSGYGSVTQYSAATATIERGLHALTPRLVDTTPMVGQVLRITEASGIGSWGYGGATPAYQWYRGSTAISGATKPTYEVQAADLGRAITVRVTGTRDGYAPASRTSTASSKVVKGVFTVKSVTIAGLVDGAASVGLTLRADTGGWSPSATSFSYAWYRSGVPIPGATGATYELVAADKGTAITVTVVGSRPAFVTASATSSPTPVILG
jgi:hypothetical protein